MARLGLNRDRLRLAWISAAEGLRFSQEISALKEIVEQVTPEEIDKGIKAFSQKGERSHEATGHIQ
jgi:coenzyme F420-reducing hydrogenase delta subunit